MPYSYSRTTAWNVVICVNVFVSFVDARISVSSSSNPTLSGTYVRGVLWGHEEAFVQGGKDENINSIWLFRRKLENDRFRWYLGEDISSTDALAFMDTSSSSNEPCDYHYEEEEENDKNKNNQWMVATKEGLWKADDDFHVICHGMDPGGIRACNSNNATTTTTSNQVPCVELKGGVHMPVILLGTAYISASHGAGRDHPEVIEEAPAIERAIDDDGYPGLDLGSQLHPAYANEKQVGDLLAARPGRRESLFLTTKLSPSEHGYHATLRGVQRSLRLLQTDTIDLFLIHHPQCLMVDHCEGDWLDSWKAMEHLYQLGAVRAIGVSNFDAPRLHHLLTTLATIPVAVLQNRADPLAPEQPNVLELCHNHGIQYQAFSVLGRQWVVGPWSYYWRHPQHPILDHPQIVAIANRLSHRSDTPPTMTMIRPAQVVLRWALQKGWTVVPKTSNVERLESNRQLFHFQLTEEDMAVIDHLPQPPLHQEEL